MDPSHLCTELRLGDNERWTWSLTEDTHTLGCRGRGRAAVLHRKQLEALLRSLMGSGNEVSSSPLSVLSVTGLNAHGLHKVLMLQRKDQL